MTFHQKSTQGGKAIFGIPLKLQASPQNILEFLRGSEPSGPHMCPPMSVKQQVLA